MIQVIYTWFRFLSKKMKIVTVVIVLILLALSVQSARLARSEYLRLKAIEEVYKEAQKAIEEAEIKELNIVTKNKNTTVKTKFKNKDINTKLKEDEKIINADSVSNNELSDFISKHEN